jgi:Protein of unknown function (DUF2726)
MSVLLATLLVFVTAAFLWFAFFRSQKTRAIESDLAIEAWRARTVRPLTRTEMHALSELKLMAPDCLLMPQVSLSRFIKIKSSLSYSNWFHKVGRRCVDFLICLPGGDVLGVVEVYTGTTPPPSVSKGTQAKEQTLAQANIPLWYLNPELPMSVHLLRDALEAERGNLAAQISKEPVWAPTEEAPRKAGIEAIEMDDERWNQPWPTEGNRPTEMLDLMEQEPPVLNERVR